jgi:hypothetical protein
MALAQKSAADQSDIYFFHITTITKPSTNVKHHAKLQILGRVSLRGAAGDVAIFLKDCFASLAMTHVGALIAELLIYHEKLLKIVRVS